MKKIALVHWTLVLLFVALLCFAGVGIKAAVATDKSDKAPAPSTDPAVIEAVKKVEREMGDAMVAADIGKLDEIFADDWATIGRSGRVITKEKVLEDFKSGKDKLVSFEIGPMDVQVFGDVAVAHASVTEKRIREGKDDSGESVWMDLLEKRAGKWVVVRSAGESLK
jgi:ketosteroid isomerase-like protein